VSEVVEALRDGADDEAAKMFCPHLVEAAENAAATIERLTAERDRMREALLSAAKIPIRIDQKDFAEHTADWLDGFNAGVCAYMDALTERASQQETER
jgi:hypothetical protein